MVVATPEPLQIQGAPAVDWQCEPGLVPYCEAVGAMEARVAAIRRDAAPELVWLVEHPPLYTAGTSAKAGDLIDGDRFPVHRTGRGGQYTYHGPGQRIAYVMLDLHRRGRDLRAYVQNLEQWVISTLAGFDIVGARRNGRVGIWVDRGGGREDKIAAIGVRVRHWVTYHGIAINVTPELSHFEGIVPCGIADPNLGVTSFADLGVGATMSAVDRALHDTFSDIFG